MDKKELNSLIDRYKSTCLMCDHIQKTKSIFLDKLRTVETVVLLSRESLPTTGA